MEMNYMWVVMVSWQTWISFLKEPNTTSNGIYPVYLYYKEDDILILAYGISETTTPDNTDGQEGGSGANAEITNWE